MLKNKLKILNEWGSNGTPKFKTEKEQKEFQQNKKEECLKVSEKCKIIEKQFVERYPISLIGYEVKIFGSDINDTYYYTLCKENGENGSLSKNYNIYSTYYKQPGEYSSIKQLKEKLVENIRTIEDFMDYKIDLELYNQQIKFDLNSLKLVKKYNGESMIYSALTMDKNLLQIECVIIENDCKVSFNIIEL